MKQKIFIIVVFISVWHSLNAQTDLHFSNLDSLFIYAENNTVTIKNAENKTLISKWQKIAAQAGLVNFRMQTNFNMTNNIELPVTYLPGEIFGGEPGSLKEVTTGQQYNSNLSIIPQIDIINPVSWAKLKSTKVDSEVTEIDNLITKKNLFESISATYYNIVSLQEQVNITTKTLQTADSLLLNIQNKYTQGIVRLQDLNDTKINKLTTADKLQQIEKSLKQQYYSLKILCDIPQDSKISIDEKIPYEIRFNDDLKTNNQLKYKMSLLEIDKAQSDIKQNQYGQLPTVSLVFYDAWQQNSNTTFFDSNTDWINPKYIGLKVSLPFPNIGSYTKTKTARITKTILEQNAEHTKLQNELENKQMKLDYEKAFSQLKIAEEIKELKEENYNLSLNQFNADILSSDKLLTAFNDMLVSRLNSSTAHANLLHSISKININNKIK